MIIKLVCALLLVNLDLISSNERCVNRFGPRDFKKLLKCCEADIIQSFAQFEVENCTKFAGSHNRRCLIECIIAESDLLEDGKFDNEKVKSFLPYIIEDEEVKTLTEDAFERCINEKFADDNKVDKSDHPHHKHGPRHRHGECEHHFDLGRVLFCVRLEVLKACPENLWNQNNNEECVTFQDELQLCDP